MRIPSPALTAVVFLLSSGCATQGTAESQEQAFQVFEKEWFEAAAGELGRLAGSEWKKMPPSELRTVAQLAVENTQFKYIAKIKSVLEEGGWSTYHAIGYTRSMPEGMVRLILTVALSSRANKGAQDSKATIRSP